MPYPHQPSYPRLTLGVLVGHIAGVPITTAALYISTLDNINTAGARIIPIAIIIVAVLWALIKIYQTSIAGLAETEYSTSSVVVGLFVGILLTAVLLSGIGILVSLMMITIPEAAIWVILGTIGLVSIPVIAWVFTWEGIMNYQKAWRPLEAYWKPFYAGIINPMDSEEDID